MFMWLLKGYSGLGVGGGLFFLNPFALKSVSTADAKLSNLKPMRASQGRQLQQPQV